MKEVCDLRCWDELIPDALGLIFRNLSLEEILTVIPRVCKSWRRAVMGPYCWQDIDIQEWSQSCHPEKVENMLQMLILRSSGSLRKLCVSSLTSDRSLSFIADHAKHLQNLGLPSSKISESIVEQVAVRLSNLTFLDLSYCVRIGARALEAIGNHCKFLAELRRNMHPFALLNKFSQDDKALAIASTMPKFKHLELANLLLSTDPVLAILSNCCELELLDIRGCWHVKLDNEFVKKISGLKLVGPHVVDCYEANSWDDCSDYSGTSEYLDWDFMAGGIDGDYDDAMYGGIWEDQHNIDQLDLRLYDGFDVDTDGFDWPVSH